MKTMLLVILPNWNSLDPVRQAHSDLELTGLVFFALLVVAEALAHNSKQEERKHLFDSIGIWFFAIAILCEVAGYWYGQRNDALSEQKIRSLDALAANAASNASTALDKSGTALSNSKEAETKSSDAVDKAGNAQEKVGAVAKRAEQVDEELGQAEFLMSARYINDPKTLTEQLSQFKGMPVTLRSYMGDAEAWGLCFSLWHIANDAKMVATDECGRSFFTVPLVSPMSVQGPDDDVMLALSGFISRTGRLGVSSGPYRNAPHSLTLVIFVGVKSPFMIGQARGVKLPTKKQAKTKSAKP